MSAWVVDTLAGYLAAESKHAIADAVLAHMVRSYRVDPRWIMRQRRIALDVAEQQARQAE